MNTDEYYKIAPYYEKLLSRFLYPIRKNICTFIHYHKHTKIIDVCCGTGKQLEMIAADNMVLTGVDLSPAMLNEAISSNNIEFLQLNAAEIDLPAKSFDAVILSLSLHEKNDFDREIIAQKCWALVRPGGHLLITDYCQTGNTFMGVITGKIIIPIIERVAGFNHFQCYKSWMQKGAVENFLQIFHQKADIISTHFFDSIMICTIEKESELNEAFYATNLLEE